MEKSISRANAYDDVPYASFPFSQTHPARLATIGTIFGLPSRVSKNVRVLELGSSSGGNLIPLAEQFPHGHFVGIDASVRTGGTGGELFVCHGQKFDCLMVMSEMA